MRFGRVVVGVVVWAAVAGATGLGTQAAAETAVFNSSPASGEPGTTITAWYGTPCVSPGPGAEVTVALSSRGGTVAAQATASVYSGGQWYVHLAVPPSASSGGYGLTARCSTSAGTYLTYTPRSFTVTDSTSTTTTSTTTTSTTTSSSTTTTTAPPPAGGLVQISSDPFTNSTSQHQTQVEPDTFAYGGTIVSAFQSGRFYDGGSSGIGWARSTDGGKTWTHGFLPSLTVHASPAGPYDRASDPSVAYDPRHQVWLISTLAIMGTRGAAVTVSRSSDGLTWSSPVVVASTSGFYDKNWVVCDTHASSAFYGHCYVTFDDEGVGDRLLNSTSTDGGVTWGAPSGTADNAYGLGGQPLVQPNGTVVVPVVNASLTAVGAYRSLDGGSSWSAVTRITALRRHRVAGSLRSLPLPSAEIDGIGRVFVVWSDCRFRSNCASNDIVITSSLDGVSWTPVARVPIDGVSSTVDHFIPGLAVDPSTAGGSARLALTYYFYPKASCTTSTCRLNVGTISSANGAGSWGAARRLNPTAMSVGWLPNTTQGYMVGDYISTSFVNGQAVATLALATAPGTSLHEAIYAAAV